MSTVHAEQTFLGTTELAPRPVLPQGALAGVDQLLRQRTALLQRIEAGEELPDLARAMIVTIALSAAAFGAALGYYRGGVQIFYAAVKLPMVVLLTAAICTPALSALRRVVHGRTSLQRDLALVLTSLALGSLLLGAMAPIIILGVTWGASYHHLILATVGCCGLAGAVGLALFVRGLTRLKVGERLLVGGALLLVVALAGTQMTWTLRPYLVRPRTQAVPFVRSLEGSFSEAVRTSLDSSRGVYHRSTAPLPE